MIRAMRKAASMILAAVLLFGGGAVLAADPSVVREESFASPALAAPLRYWIYLPPDYPSLKGPLPVAYLLHGAKGEGADWVHAGHVRDTADRMIAGGKLRPLILVMPDAQNSWYVDSKAAGGVGDYETAIGRDLLAWIEGHYNVSRDGSGRAIAGISMGGFGAFRLAMIQPDRFAAAASLSGAFWSQMTPEIAQNPRVERIFAQAFPAPIDVEKFIRSEPRTLAGEMKAKKGRSPAFLIAYGRQDLGGVMVEGQKLYEQLKAMGADVRLETGDGGHDWDFWEPAIWGMFAFFEDAFRQAKPLSQEPRGSSVTP